MNTQTHLIQQQETKLMAHNNRRSKKKNKPAENKQYALELDPIQWRLKA